MRNKIYILVILSLLLVSCSRKKEQKEMTMRLRDINELQLEELTLSKTYTVRDQYYENQEHGYKHVWEEIADWMHHNTRVGARIGVYGINRNYSAYINLNELRHDDVRFEEDNMYVSLPPVRIKVLGNDMVPDAIHERVTGLRWRITEPERNAMKMKAAQQLDSIMNESNSPIVEELKTKAQRKAQKWIEAVIESRGYTPIVTFRN